MSFLSMRELYLFTFWFSDLCLALTGLKKTEHSKTSPGIWPLKVKILKSKAYEKIIRFRFYVAKNSLCGSTKWNEFREAYSQENSTDEGFVPIPGSWSEGIFLPFCQNSPVVRAPSRATCYSYTLGTLQLGKFFMFSFCNSMILLFTSSFFQTFASS